MENRVASREFYTLIRQIGETYSKQEEDKLIGQEVTRLKNHFKSGNIYRGIGCKEFVIRLLYCELLGHECSFGYIEAIKLTSSKCNLTTRIGYLAVSLIVPKTHELNLLIIANIQKDLESNNFLQVNSALSISNKVLTVETIPSLLPLIKPLLNHPLGLIRKKVMVLFNTIVNLEERSVYDDIFEICRKGLSDKDPSVMGVSLNLLYDLLRMYFYKESGENKVKVKLLNLCNSSVTSIFDQLLDRSLPLDYMYNRVCLPWVQIKLLNIIAFICKNDEKQSAKYYTIIRKCIKRNDIGLLIGYAIVYESVKTITQIYINKKLIQLVLSSITRLISSNNHNLKYVGMYCLRRIIKLNKGYASERFQNHVIDALDSTDNSLRSITLSLLCTMASQSNIDVIIEKLFNYLSKTICKIEKQMIVKKIIQLFLNFNYTLKNSFMVVEKLFRYDPRNGYIPYNQLIRHLIDKHRQVDVSELKSYLLNTVIENVHLYDFNFLKIVSWFLVEEFSDTDIIVDSFCDMVEKFFTHNFMKESSDNIKTIIFLNFFKILKDESILKTNELKKQIIEVTETHLKSKNLSTQQICYEFCHFLKSSKSINENMLVTAIDFDMDVIVDKDLKFLNSYISKSIVNGQSKYLENVDILVEEDSFLLGGNVNQMSNNNSLQFEHRKIVQTVVKSESNKTDPLDFINDVKKSEEQLVNTDDPDNNLYLYKQKNRISNVKRVWGEEFDSNMINQPEESDLKQREISSTRRIILKKKKKDRIKRNRKTKILVKQFFNDSTQQKSENFEPINDNKEKRSTIKEEKIFDI